MRRHVNEKKKKLLCHILNKVHAEGKVALATAASGIADTLPPKGTTFHSKTKCPLNMTALQHSLG